MKKDGGKYVKEYILEACVDSVESAMAAVEGGADRLELCGNLIIGGTTPGPWLFDEIRKRSDIRIHALIRPRFGDFCYTDAEFSMIKHAVEDFRKMGAEGVVFGVLKPDGTLNMEQMKELMEAAGDMSVTLHRAFDVCVDPIETMEQAISLGINTILTSGQRNVCLQGADLLKELVEKSLGRITIQAGSGVGAEVIRQLYPLTGVRAYHMTGKRVIDSEMQFRKEGVNMGLPMLSEYEIWRTDVDNIRAAKKVLEEL
jgi:copper homeostasis protein